MALKVCMLEVVHWHNRLYYQPLQKLGIGVAAVSDKDPPVAQRLAGTLGSRAYTDYREMVQKERPDFAIALGRHCDMAAIARFLLEEGVPFAMEKPMGMNSQEVAGLAALAEQKGAFVAVPYVIRYSPCVKKIQEVEGPAADLTHAHFGFASGPISRYYESGCEWVLTRAQAGGGCLMNIGVHFIDLFLYLTGKKVKRVHCTTSNSTWGTEVETFAAVTMETEDGSVCLNESSYSHAPVPWTSFLSFVLSTRRSYFRSWGKEGMLWFDEQGRADYVAGPFHNTAFYPTFVADTIDALQKGRPPIAGIKDNLATIRIVDAAYQSAALGRVVELS